MADLEYIWTLLTPSIGQRKTFSPSRSLDKSSAQTEGQRHSHLVCNWRSSSALKHNTSVRTPVQSQQQKLFFLLPPSWYWCAGKYNLNDLKVNTMESHVSAVMTCIVSSLLSFYLMCSMMSSILILCFLFYTECKHSECWRNSLTYWEISSKYAGLFLNP